MELFDLFRAFFTVGICTFGGGPAMFPVLTRELAVKRDYTTEEELADYYAIGQCTPGVIAVNVATFIGYKRRGILGGIVSTAGLVCPSIIIITLIAAFLQNFMDITWVQHAFSGLRAGVCALMVTAVLRLVRKAVKNVFGIIVCAIVFCLFMFVSVSPVILVVSAALLGVLYQVLYNKGGKK